MMRCILEIYLVVLENTWLSHGYEPSRGTRGSQFTLNCDNGVESDDSSRFRNEVVVYIYAMVTPL